MDWNVKKRWRRPWWLQPLPHLQCEREILRWQLLHSREPRGYVGFDCTTLMAGKTTEICYAGIGHVINTIMALLISGPDGPAQDLAPGEYIIPFSCPLSASLPSSFEGKHGHIRYTLIATMHRPCRFNSEAQSAFSVIAPLDLNCRRYAMVSHPCWKHNVINSVCNFSEK